MDESSPDAKWFNNPVFNFSKNKEKPDKDTSIPETSTSDTKELVPRPVFDRDALYYDMSGEKYLIILNHYRFKRTRYFQYKEPTTRNGTEKDVRSLEILFGKLGFKVTTHTDLEYEQVIKEIRRVCGMDHSRTSCICVTILTHGDSGDVYAADRPYRLMDVMAIFENQSSLVNKPKLFFIQACRGDKMDSGQTVKTDGEASFTVPTHADFLTLYSTVEDYVSYRNSLGSFLIQSLCKVIEECHADCDILHLITLVNRRVAYEYSTYTTNPETNDKKQMPEARYTLTKLLKFNDISTNIN